MKNIICGLLAGLIVGCTLTPEQQAAHAKAQEARAQQLSVSLAARCDPETARLMALQYQGWQGASEADRTAYAERFADARFQFCYRMAQENYRLEQHLRDMEELEWRRDMRRERDWLMDRPFFRHPYGLRRW